MSDGISPEEQKRIREEERRRNNDKVKRSYRLRPNERPKPNKIEIPSDKPADVIPFKRKDDKDD